MVKEESSSLWIPGAGNNGQDGIEWDLGKPGRRIKSLSNDWDFYEASQAGVVQIV